MHTSVYTLGGLLHHVQSSQAMNSLWILRWAGHKNKGTVTKAYEYVESTYDSNEGLTV